MKVSDYIVSFFADKGITDAFGYPGGMVTHLMDSFSKQNRIRAHVNYHEQASAFSACGYAQISRLPGVAYATSGPGATNLITGIANAYFDSVPCIFITGQVNTYEAKADTRVRQKGFQETDIVSIASSVTKYSFQITDEKDMRYQLEKAYHLAVSGRPGPVLLDIPMNIQRQEINPNELKSFFVKEDENKGETELLKAQDMLYSAKRPCFLLGAGIKQSGEIKSVRQMISKLGIPVLSSMPAFDICPGHPLFYGFVGAYGSRTANFILAKSDLIISVGSRLDVRQTGSAKENFAPGAKLVRIDIDKDEMSNKIKDDELQIQTHLKNAIDFFLKNTDTNRMSVKPWVTVCNSISQKLDGLDMEAPHKMINALSKLIPDNTVITTDVGQNQVWIAQAFKAKENQEILFSGGHGAMGYSLPAAIGAHYASGKKVVSFSGDGGIQMNMQELQFVKRENLPVKIVILNNNALGMIRHFQEMYFDKNYSQTVRSKGYTSPDFSKIAFAYDIPYYKVSSKSDLNEQLFDNDNPAVIEAALCGDTYVFPKLAMNKPNQDQDPPIDRVLYNELMEL